MTKTGKPGRGTATFTVTVTNLGPSDSQNVSLTATSSLFTGPPPTTSTSSGATCTVGDGTVMCSWASLASGASVQAIVTVEWRSSVGSTCTSVTVTAGTADPNATNNNGSVCISKR